MAGDRGLSRRLDELAEVAPTVSSAALGAREGRLDDAAVAVVGGALERLEATLRARALYAAQ